MKDWTTVDEVAQMDNDRRLTDQCSCMVDVLCYISSVASFLSSPVLQCPVLIFQCPVVVDSNVDSFLMLKNSDVDVD